MFAFGVSRISTSCIASGLLLEVIVDCVQVAAISDKDISNLDCLFSVPLLNTGQKKMQIVGTVIFCKLVPLHLILECIVDLVSLGHPSHIALFD